MLTARRDNFGVSLSTMTPARIAEANEAYNLLEGTGLSLLDLVRTGMAVHKARTQSVPCTTSSSMRKRLVTPSI